MPWSDFQPQEVVVLGPNNASIDINPTSGDPVIYFHPNDVGPPAATDTIQDGAIYVTTLDYANQVYKMIVSAPVPLPGGSVAQIELTSSNKAGSDQPTIVLNGTLSDGPSGMNYLNGQTGTGSTPVGAAAATIVTAGQTFVFPVPFPVGVTPNVHCNMNNNAVNTATWNCRAVAINNTGFDIRASGTAPGGVGFTLGFQYTAITPA